jgi:hypothetical protein
MKKNGILLILFCFFISCVRDKKSTDPKTDYGVYSPTIALGEYCCFNKNSYWVYEDSISGKIDCTYVTSAQVTTYTVGSNSGKDYTGIFHYYNMFTKDGIGDIRQYEVHDEDAAQSADCCGGRYYCETHWNRPSGPVDSMGGSTPGIYFGSYTFMFNNFTNGTTGGSGYGEQCWSKGQLNSIKVNSISYTNSVIFENSVNITDQNWVVHPYRFKNFIVKNIGVVKRIDLDSNRTWLLKRYSVSQ